MIDFHNSIVILGAITFIVLPFILKIKTTYKIIFIICSLIAIASTFYNDSNTIKMLGTLTLIIPFIVSRIKKNKLFKREND